jgi:hypothetical protein
MLAIKVELHPFGDENSAKNIGNMIIYNKGGTRERGEYGVVLLKEGVSIKEGREELLGRAYTMNGESDLFETTAEVKDYPRLDLPVWELVTEALSNAGYGDTRSK